MGPNYIKSSHIDVRISEKNLEYIKKFLCVSLAELFDGVDDETSTGCKEAQVDIEEILHILKDASKKLKTESPVRSLDKYSMFRMFYMVLINNGAHVYLPGRPPVALTYVRLQDLGIKKRYKVIISDDDKGVIRGLFERTEKLVSSNMGLRKAAIRTEHSDDATFGAEQHEIFTSNKTRGIREVNLEDIKHIPEEDEGVARFKEPFKKVEGYLGTSRTAKDRFGKMKRYMASYTKRELCLKSRKSKLISEITLVGQVGQAVVLPVSIQGQIKHQSSENPCQELKGEEAASELIRLANCNARSREKLRRWFLFNLMDRRFSATFKSSDSRRRLKVEAKDLNHAPALLIEKTLVLFVRKDLCYRLRKTDDEENLYLERIDHQQVKKHIRKAPRVRFCDPPGKKDRYIDISVCRWT